PGIGFGLCDLVVWVVTPPKKQHARLMVAMISAIGLKPGRMSAVIGEDAELHINASRLAHALPVEMPAIRRHKRHQALRDIADIGVLYAFKIQPFGNLREIFGRGISPIRLHESPGLAKALFMSI